VTGEGGEEADVFPVQGGERAGCIHGRSFDAEWLLHCIHTFFLTIKNRLIGAGFPARL
jgi:hypothetical protein